MNIHIHIQPHTLSDGSEAFQVRLPRVALHATSERAACKLADAIFDAINQYTLETAEIIYGQPEAQHDPR